MTGNPSEEKWQVRVIRSGLPGIDRLPELTRLPWLARPLMPAEVGAGLRDVMLNRDNMLEDVNYQKIVPNQYIVEVSESNFAQHYRPILGQIIKQWQDRLLEDLITANSRQGRKEFRFGGRLALEVRPSSGLKDTEARILSRIAQEPSAASPGPRVSPPPSARPKVPPPQSYHHQPESDPRQNARPVGPVHTTLPDPPQPARPGTGSESTNQPVGSVAYLELVPTGQRWALYPGINTIGRSNASQIYLDMPVVQEKRLVSGQHAFIVFENGECRLFDGAPGGRPSANGTYVNLRRVPPAGYRLQNGDAIVLAAVDPLFPRSDTPGVVTFYFWTSRRD